MWGTDQNQREPGAVRTANRPRRFGVLLAAAAIAAAVTASVAFGAVGDLSNPTCIKDTVLGPDDCDSTADGLDDVTAAAVSPDGENLYAVSWQDDAIVTLDRNTSTGALSNPSCIKNAAAGECGAAADELENAHGVAVSPDGESVYVASFVDDAIVNFDRDPDTGALSNDRCVIDTPSAPGLCSSSAQGLNGARSVAVSPDGTSVYVASEADHAIVRFDRDTVAPGLGDLSNPSCIRDAALGECGAFAEGLSGPFSVTVSSDNESVYVASILDDAIVNFDRDTGTGALSNARCVKNAAPGECSSSAQGLDGARSVTVSPDGKSVYAASEDDDAIVRFDRDTVDPGLGDLSSPSCFKDVAPGECAASAEGLNGAASIAVSADDESVYVASFSDSAVAFFDRNTSTGALSDPQCVKAVNPGECGSAADGLVGPDGIAVSPDPTTSVYAASSADDAIVTFDRDSEVATAPPPPVHGSTVNVEPVSGTVKVKLPGASGFTQLSSADQIPTGSIIDTRGGTVKLISESNFGGPDQSAQFKYGLFKITQPTAKNSYTTLKLTGPLACGRAKGSSLLSAGPLAHAAAKKGRKLWGKGSGKFKSSGKKGSGSARGTTWQVSDLCNGKTEIRSIQGKVLAKDFVRRRTKILRTGQKYIAPGPRRRRR